LPCNRGKIKAHPTSGTNAGLPDLIHVCQVKLDSQLDLAA